MNKQGSAKKMSLDQIHEAVELNRGGIGTTRLAERYGVTNTTIRNAFAFAGYRSKGQREQRPAPAGRKALILAGRQADPALRPVCSLCCVVAPPPIDRDRDEDWTLPLAHRDAFLEPCPGQFVLQSEWKPMHGPRTIEQDFQALLLCLMVAAGGDPYGRAVWG